MKRRFGSIFTRSFVGSGTTLTDVEHSLTEELISRLPDSLKRIVESQIDVYNLVQREIDGRALNFYRVGLGRSLRMARIPVLEMDSEESPLIRISALVEGDPKPINATLTAVNGRVFCVSFGRRVDRYSNGTRVEVTGVKKAWRSNFTVTNKEGEQGGGSDAEPAV